MKKFSINEILFFSIIPVFLIIFFIIRNNPGKTAFIDNTIDNFAEMSLVAAEKLKYASFSDTNSFLKYLKEIKIEGDYLININQKESLYNSIIILVRAFSQGTYEDYMQFRLPSDVQYSYNPKMWNIIMSRWCEEHPDSEEMVPNDRNELFKWWVQMRSGGNYYKDFWKSICIDSENIYKTFNFLNEREIKSGIFIEKKQLHLLNSDKFSDELLPFSFSGFLNGSIPAYEFYESEKDDKNNEITVALLIFFAKVSKSYPSAIPIYVRYAWDENTKQWLPINLFDGNLSGEKQDACPGVSLVF